MTRLEKMEQVVCVSFLFKLVGALLQHFVVAFSFE